MRPKSNSDLRIRQAKNAVPHIIRPYQSTVASPNATLAIMDAWT